MPGDAVPGGAEVIELYAGTLAECPAAAQPSRWARWAGRFLVSCGLALLPWVVALATSLPDPAQASHWSTAWAGLDVLEASGLIVTGALLLRGDARHGPAASMTGAFLLADAWFDVVTAAPGADFASALAMALGAEFPLAALCAVLAVRAVPAGCR